MANLKLEEKFRTSDGVEVALEGSRIKVRGPKGEVSRTLSYPGVRIRTEGKDVVLEVDHPTKKLRAMVGTYTAHIKNMLKGVTEGFEYKMKVVYAHFPMTVKVQGKEILVENYLGEKIPRRTNIVGQCSVKAKGAEVSILGIDVEEVGQTAANLEQLTRVKKKDPRVFQDGIYLIERDGAKV